MARNRHYWFHSSNNLLASNCDSSIERKEKLKKDKKAETMPLLYDYEVVLQKKVVLSFAEKMTIAKLRDIQHHYMQNEKLDVVNSKYVGPSDPEYVNQD